MTEQENKTSKRPSFRWKRAGSLAALLLLGLLIGLYLGGYLRLPWQQNRPASGSVGGSIQKGTPGMTKEELIAAMQERADKSKVSLQINARPVFEDGSSKGDLFIVNPVNNAFHMKVVIHLDQTDEVIYESGMLPPNHYIEQDKLQKKLKKGKHPATAYMYIYDENDLEHSINTSTASLILTVKQ